MAKGSRGRRDTPASIATVLGGAPSRRAVKLSPLFDLTQNLLSEIEDNRLTFPQGPLTILGNPAATEARPLPRKFVRDHRGAAIRGQPFRSRAVVAFKDRPNDPVITCVRRNERREVLFAKRLMKRRGKGSGRRTWKSDISC